MKKLMHKVRPFQPETFLLMPDTYRPGRFGQWMLIEQIIPAVIDAFDYFSGANAWSGISSRTGLDSCR